MSAGESLGARARRDHTAGSCPGDCGAWDFACTGVARGRPQRRRRSAGRRPPSIRSAAVARLTEHGLRRVLGHQRAVLDRLRQRRLLDLLRARAGRLLRARAHAGRLPDHGRDLLPDRRDLRRGDRDVPRGGRLLVLRAPRLQRAVVVLRRLGADAQLHDHDRHLGVLRAALPRRAVLAGARARPGRHHLRDRRRRRCCRSSTSSASGRRRG